MEDIPAVCYSTYLNKTTNSNLSIMYNRVTDAINAGFIGFDTATSYGTEDHLRNAINNSNINRCNFFVTLKLTPKFNIKTLLTNARKFGYYDLILLHSPPLTGDPYEFKLNAHKMWLSLIQIKNKGLFRRIGISNFYPEQLKLFINMCSEYNLEYPYLNQVECHLLNQQFELKDLCDTYGIYLQAHTALGGPAKEYILNLPELVSDSIIDSYNECTSDSNGISYSKCNDSLNDCTPAQLALVYTISRGIGIVVCPKDHESMVEYINSPFKHNYITCNIVAQLSKFDAEMVLVSKQIKHYNNELKSKIRNDILHNLNLTILTQRSKPTTLLLPPNDMNSK